MSIKIGGKYENYEKTDESVTVDSKDCTGTKPEDFYTDSDKTSITNNTKFNVTVTFTINDIICDFKDKCTSYPNKCKTCKRNRGKRDYYKPDTDDSDPYIPYTPYVPYTPIWTVTTLV